MLRRHQAFEPDKPFFMYLDDGHLCYEYNLFIIMRTKIRSEHPCPPARQRSRSPPRYVEIRPGGPLNITLTANGEECAAGVVPISAPLLFTANDCLDIGTCLGAPISLDYIDAVKVRYTS